MPDFLKDFTAFCAAKSSDERYNYVDGDNCALSQFARATNRTELISLNMMEQDNILLGLNQALNPKPPLYGLCTFGALTERLTALSEA